VKAEPDRLIPRKIAANLERLIVGDQEKRVSSMLTFAVIAT